jgi:hypothetical protein
MLVGAFDSMVQAALDESAIPALPTDEGHMTDVFVFAPPDDQEAALKLYHVVQLFFTRSFGAFIQEASDCGLDEGLLRLNEARKAKLLLEFRIWYGTKCLVEFFTKKDQSFNPLFLSEWCDGLAVMFVQNEQHLWEEVTRVLLHDVFMPSGVHVSEFLGLNFGEQQNFFKDQYGAYVAALQALGNKFPQGTESAHSN